MSRYYMIQIDGGPTFTSFPNGQNDPGALQVLIDIPIASLASPAFSGAAVKIYGIPLSMISQANNLRFKNIKVYGGFKAGLPLAKPAQSGLLVQGYIFQSFGNWKGTEQSLDLVILAVLVLGVGEGDPDVELDPTVHVVLEQLGGFLRVIERRGSRLVVGKQDP